MAHYRFALDLFRSDGTLLAQKAVVPDWTAAAEWVHFDGVRRGQMPPVMPTRASLASVLVEPLWNAATGAPYARGFQLSFPENGEGSVSREIPTAYLRSAAEAFAADLVAQGQLKRGDTFRYLVAAYPADESPDPLSDDTFAVEEIEQPIHLCDASLSAMRERSVYQGEEQGDDVPVFLPHAVLLETMELARRAGDQETGGVLVGHLRRDSSVPDILLEVTAQIPALHVEASSHKLTFTAATWAAVRNAITLRRRAESMLGWWHYHPDFCRLRQCPPETRKACPATNAFFSAEDVALHAALFHRAHNVALLVSDSSKGLSAAMFGWRHGVVASRGFHTLQGEADAHRAEGQAKEVVACPEQ